jgi:hypothetical protein
MRAPAPVVILLPTAGLRIDGPGWRRKLPRKAAPHDRYRPERYGRATIPDDWNERRRHIRDLLKQSNRERDRELKAVRASLAAVAPT